MGLPDRPNDLFSALGQDGAWAALGAAATGVAGLFGFVLRHGQRHRHQDLDVAQAMGEIVDGLKAENEVQRDELRDTRAELSAVHLKLNQALRDLGDSDRRQRQTERRLGDLEHWVKSLPRLMAAACPNGEACPVLTALPKEE